MINFAENLAKLCQKADQPARVTNAIQARDLGIDEAFPFQH